jgi:hypothetical protein
LKKQETEHAAFEAAWLAHALVDGLTPAHHYPYEEKLAELRGGAGIETRTSLKAKIIMPGETAGQQVINNWKMWGPKGLLTTHGLFEIGIAALIAPLKFTRALPNDYDISEAKATGLGEFFKHTAKEIAYMDLYHEYYRTGWTPRLAMQVRKRLAPAIIKTVTLAWCLAAREAQSGKRPGKA